MTTRGPRGLDVWYQPSWSRDGRRILFSAKKTGEDQIYRINSDGTGLVQLTPGGR
jgi:Tol biopolymer transport system component